jgi:hypothetical protein
MMMMLKTLSASGTLIGMIISFRLMVESSQFLDAICALDVSWSEEGLNYDAALPGMQNELQHVYNSRDL